MFPVRVRIALGLITALVIALLSSTAALAQGPWPNDPQGPIAASIAELYWIMFVAAVVVLAIVDGAIIYAGIRFRERPGHVAKQFHGHNMLELTWTVIPTLMVVSFSVLSWQKLDFINNSRGGDVGDTYEQERLRAFAAKDALTWLVQGFLAVPPVLEHAVERLGSRPAAAQCASRTPCLVA